MFAADDIVLLRLRNLPIEALMMATGLPSRGVSALGLEAQSIAFLSTPGN